MLCEKCCLHLFHRFLNIRLQKLNITETKSNSHEARYQECKKVLFSELTKILRMDGDKAEGMLNDDHIKYFDEILLENGIDIKLQSTLLRQRLDHVIQAGNQKFIQILHSGSYNEGHWVCVYHEDNVIHLYDSLGQTLKKEHELFISRIFPENENIMLANEVCQIQEQTYNCGLFAIANTVALIHGICPCTLRFIESEMRPHLIKVFEKRKISMFPYKIIGKDSSQIKTATFNHQIEQHQSDIILRSVNMKNSKKAYEKWFEEFHRDKGASTTDMIDLTKVRCS